MLVDVGKQVRSMRHGILALQRAGRQRLAALRTTEQAHLTRRSHGARLAPLVPGEVHHLAAAQVCADVGLDEEHHVLWTGLSWCFHGKQYH